MAEKRKVVEKELIKSVTCCPPAVRMVVIEAWRDARGECGHRTLPVVAIQTTVVQRFLAREDQRLDAQPTAALFLKAGWEFGGEVARTDAVYVDSDGFFVEANEYCSHNGDSRVVVCDWPPAEDAARLAEHIAAAKEGAADRVERDGMFARHRQAQPAAAEPAKPTPA